MYINKLFFELWWRSITQPCIQTSLASKLSNGHFSRSLVELTYSTWISARSIVSNYKENYALIGHRRGESKRKWRGNRRFTGGKPTPGKPCSRLSEVFPLITVHRHSSSDWRLIRCATDRERNKQRETDENYQQRKENMGDWDCQLGRTSISSRVQLLVIVWSVSSFGPLWKRYGLFSQDPGYGPLSLQIQLHPEICIWFQ